MHKDVAYYQVNANKDSFTGKVVEVSFQGGILMELTKRRITYNKHVLSHFKLFLFRSIFIY